MSIKIVISRLFCQLVSVLLSVLFVQISWAGVLDKDPIEETQTNAVAVTAETFKKYETKPGAPAPTFKIVNDTGTFFVEKPTEKLKEVKPVEETKPVDEPDEKDNVESIENPLPSVTETGK